MTEETKKAIECYQCSGCMSGCDISCYKEDPHGNGCGGHRAGTFASSGKIFLGMPTGFNRLGACDDTKIYICNNTTDDIGIFDKFNIPVWKYKDENGNILVRGLRPRTNVPFINIYLEDCMEDIVGGYPVGMGFGGFDDTKKNTKEESRIWFISLGKEVCPNTKLIKGTGYSLSDIKITPHRQV